MNRYAEVMAKLNAEVVRAGVGFRPVSLTDESIKDFETLIGHSLPWDYREFLGEYGFYGLEAEANSPALNGVWIGCITVFYGLFPYDDKSYPYGAEFDLAEMYNAFEGYCPPELLPIGDDSGQGLFCLALEGENRGAVYFWDRYVSPIGNDYSGITLVAKSFDDFMRMLQVYEDSS
jgi:hypothetical protein